MAKASRQKILILRSMIERRARAGSVCQKASGARSVWMMNTPPSASPASGSLWRKTLGSGDSTTSTCLSSQFSRIGSCAKTA